MRMSDWSSDVCSSDLRKPGHCGSCAPSGADSARRPSGRSRRHRATGARRFLHWLPWKLPNQKYQRWVEVACWGKPNTVTTVLAPLDRVVVRRSEEHTSELQSLMRISYAVFCLKKKKPDKH